METFLKNLIKKITPRTSNQQCTTGAIQIWCGGKKAKLVGLLLGVITISDINIMSITDKSAQVTWRTNNVTDSQINYGTTTDYELGAIIQPNMVIDHQINLTNLIPQQEYHFRIRSSDAQKNIDATSDLTFKTPIAGTGDITPPVIINTKNTYVGGKYLVIDWETNKLTDGTVIYGLTSAKLSSSKSQSNKSSLKHEVILTGLKINTNYCYQIKSKDQNKKEIVSSIECITTATNETLDKTNPDIRDISIISNRNSATITFKTLKPATSKISYSTDTKLKNSQSNKEQSVTTHTFYIPNLSPNTTYYFQISVADVTGLKLENFIQSFTTKLYQEKDSSILTGTTSTLRAPDGSIYSIVAGKKHKLINYDIFDSYGFKLNDVVNASLADMNKYPNANLLMPANGEKIYFISWKNNTKKWIPSPEVFNSYPANNWADVVVVNEKEISSFPDVNLIKLASSPTVWYLDTVKNKRQRIPTEKIFVAHGFDWSKIMTVTSADLESYAKSSDLR